MFDARMIFDLAVALLRVAAQVVLLFPWILLALFAFGWRSVNRFIRQAIGLKRALTDDVRCARGHRVELRGEFECRSCGGLFAGWAYQHCPICGAACGHVACDRCGLAVRNPLV
jgi:hypothetical protein